MVICIAFLTHEFDEKFISKSRPPGPALRWVALPRPAGLMTRSGFQPEFLRQRRFELVPTSDSI
jgi:hypothetical protein